jgi:hypothetical protein
VRVLRYHSSKSNGGRTDLMTGLIGLDELPRVQKTTR